MQLVKPTNSTTCIGIHVTQTVTALIKSYNWSNQHGQQWGQLLRDTCGTSAIRSLSLQDLCPWIQPGYGSSVLLFLKKKKKKKVCCFKIVLAFRVQLASSSSQHYLNP